MTVAGFPNLFMIHGPGSPGVFFTMPLGAGVTDQVDRLVHPSP